MATTVLLVRHADVNTPAASNNPPLNAAGKARAKVLAHVAGAAGVTTVWTSTFERTKQTAKPLAALLGLQPQEVPPVEELAEVVAGGTGGHVILIAGHSDTVPEMIAALGVSDPPAVGHTEFDNLFVVTVHAPGEATLARLKYGKPSA